MKKTSLMAIVVALYGCSAQLAQPVCEKLSKCKSSIISQPVVNTVESGVIYSIPRQSFRFTLKRTAVTKATLTKSVDDTKAALAAISAQVKKRKSDTESLEKLVAAASAGEAKAKLSLELEIEKLYLALEEGKQKAAAAALEKAERELKAFKKEHIKDTVKLAALPVVPSEQRFVAKLHRSEMSSETVELKTTPEGLLSSGTGNLEGQTDEIFVALASAIQSIGAVKGFSPKFDTAYAFLEAPDTDMPPDEGPNAPRPECKSAPTEFEYTFNPNDANEYRDGDKGKVQKWLVQLKKKLEANGICYALELADPNQINEKRPPVFLDDNSVKTFDGLLYPRTTNWAFNLYDTRLKSGRIKQDTLMANLIDPYTLGVVPLQRSLFANNDFEFEFKDGLLIRYKSVTPSEAVAFLGMFPAAAKAIVSIPAEIIKLRIDYSSSEEAYYKAQEAAILARQSLADTELGQQSDVEPSE